MSDKIESGDDLTPIQKKGWVTYINPFVIIRKDDEPTFFVSTDEANDNTYSSYKLCEVVTALPLEAIHPFKLLVCFDGAIAFPKIKKTFGPDVALEHFNYVLCSLLLGGIRCEAVDRRDVVEGELGNDLHIWPVDLGQSLSSHIHALLRMKISAGIDRGLLLHPINITVSEIREAFGQGLAVLQTLGDFTPTFFLRGYTELRFHNYSDALANLWICMSN